MEFPSAFKVDLLVDRRLIVELKSIERLQPVHSKQLLTYLRLMKLPVGLLINFGCDTLKEGIKRVVNNHEEYTANKTSLSLRPLREQKSN